VTVQSQLRGTLTFSSMISHTLPESKKQFFQVGIESDLCAVWKCFNFHQMVVTLQ